MTDRATRRLQASREEDITEAAALVQAGGLVAFPTDTVYGLGTTVWDAQAVARIFAAKERPSEKAIPILIADIDRAGELLAGLPAGLAELASALLAGRADTGRACQPRCAGDHHRRDWHGGAASA